MSDYRPPTLYLAILAVALLAAMLLLSGCGGGGEEEPEPEPPKRTPVDCRATPKACI